MKLLFFALALTFVSADFNEQVDELRRALLDRVQKELVQKKYEELKRFYPDIAEKDTILGGMGWAEDAFDKKDLEKDIAEKDIMPGAGWAADAFNKKDLEKDIVKKDAANSFNEVKKDLMERAQAIKKDQELKKRELENNLLEFANAVKKEEEKTLEKRVLEVADAFKKEVLEKKMLEVVDYVKKSTDELQKKELEKKMLEVVDYVKKSTDELQEKDLEKKMLDMTEAVKNEAVKKEEAIKKNMLDIVNTVKKNVEVQVQKQKKAWRPFACKNNGEWCNAIRSCCTGNCYYGGSGMISNIVKSGTCRDCFEFEMTCNTDAQCCGAMQCDKQKALAINGVCKPLRKLNEPCIENNQCESTYCLEENKNFGLGTGTCFAPASVPSGDVCKQDKQCQSGDCDHELGSHIFGSGLCV